MATYKESGVDVELGDKCSRIAYEAAKGTFPGREGKVGSAVVGEGGFAGLLDMGDYYLVQNDDGVGTKIEVAERMRKFDTLGYDLLAMVADDAICLGAEVISVSNTLDVPSLDEVMVQGLMKGLKQAALEQNIVVPGGELAELGGALNGAVWNATAVGIVKKDRVLDGADISVGDAVIGLKSDGIRSNGLSLARMILSETYGDNWHEEDFGGGETWGDVILRPSRIYHRALLNIMGDYENPKDHPIKGIVHNTGGGIRGNLPRLLKGKGMGAKLDALVEPHPFMLKLMELGQVSVQEAYRTWNMGIGMMLVADQGDADALLEALSKEGIEAQLMGEVAGGEDIQF